MSCQASISIAEVCRGLWVNEGADASYPSTGRCSYLQQILFKVPLKSIDEEVKSMGPFILGHKERVGKEACWSPHSDRSLIYSVIKCLAFSNSAGNGKSFPAGMTDSRLESS